MSDSFAVVSRRSIALSLVIQHNLNSRNQAIEPYGNADYGGWIQIERLWPKMQRVITYGTFDLLDYGHINLLRRARALGDYLIVALSTDEFNTIEKNKKCYFPYEQRKALLESIRYVDLVIPEESWEQKAKDIKDYRIDIFVIGDDWTGEFDFLIEEGCQVVYLPRTPEISTTQIKTDISCKADTYPQAL